MNEGGRQLVRVWRWRWLALLGLLCWGQRGMAAGEPERRSFPLAGGPTLLEAAGDEGRVYFRSMRLNRALNDWNVEVTVTNHGQRILGGPFVLRVESFSDTTGPQQPDGFDADAPPRAFYVLTPSGGASSLLPRQGTVARTLSLGVVAGTNSPRLGARLFSRPGSGTRALGLTRTLNGVGQPLAGVAVLEMGPLGPALLSSDPDYGVVTLGQGEGAHTWLFQRAGYLPVWRQATLIQGGVDLIPSPRLVPLTPLVTTVPGGLAQEVTAGDGAVRIEFGAGAFAGSSQVRLTVVDGQTLPALLPQGWSPWSAFWLDSSVEPAQSVVATLAVGAPLEAGRAAALVRWHETLLFWEVTQALVGTGTNRVTVSVPGSGAYALAVPDGPPITPPAPAMGQPLLGSAVVAPALETLRAGGQVTPATSAPSAVASEVTGQARVMVTNSAGLLASGLPLRGWVSEGYQLQDGSQRFAAAYEIFLTGYQLPGDADPSRLGIVFPMRPQLLVGADQLVEATVRVEVVAPGRFEGSVVETNGGVLSSGLLGVHAPEAAYDRPQAAVLRELVTTNFAGLVFGGFEAVAGFDLTVAPPQPGRALSLQVSNLTPNQHFVLARVLSDVGFNGLEPVERLMAGTNDTLLSQEPAQGARLPGLRRAGQYLLLRAPGPEALVDGVVRDALGQTKAGAAVRLQGLPWLSVSGADGRYQLLAPTGSVQLLAVDGATGQADFVDLEIFDAQGVFPVDMGLGERGPRALAVSPPPGARRVGRVTPIGVSFSKPVNPATLLNGGLQLLGTNGLPVAGSLTLNLRGTVATFLSLNPLAPAALHTIVLSNTIADVDGRVLEGLRTFSFTTESDALNRSPGQLIIYEPTNGLAAVFGTPGTADPESPVILINESTGETATILSKPDGSFTNIIPAEVDHFLSAAIVNQNGTRTVVPASRQEFRDGSVGLFGGGGILEAEGDGGPVQVIVEPGTVPNKAKFKLDFIPVADLLALAEGQLPREGSLLGGLRYTESGDALKQPVEVSMAVNVADLNLPPGTEPTDGAFGLVIPRKFDGTVVYELIDTLEFEPGVPGQGKLVTHSPPFPGLLARKLALLQQTVRRDDLLSSVTVSTTDPVKGATTVNLGVMTFDLPLSFGAKIAGHVRSAHVTPGGEPIEPRLAVAGALIVADDVNADRPPGFLLSGEVVATSAEDGSFSTYTRPRSLGVGRELLASHPRFPFQTAQVGLPIDLPNTAVARVEFLFAEGTIQDTTDPANDSALPQLSVSHEPALPPVGQSEDNATILEMIGKDDLEVKRLEVKTVTIFDERGDELPPDVLQKTVLPAEVTLSGARRIQRLKLRASVKCKAVLTLLIKDNLHAEIETDYAVHFGFSARFDSVDPDDHVPPFVSAVWPPKFSENIPPRSPIFVRFSEPMNPNQFAPDQWGQWLQFTPPHQLTYVDANADVTEITVFYEGPPEGKVKMTIQSPLGDRNSNRIDTNPAEDGSQPLELEFTQAETRDGSLSGSGRGAGVVVHGNYAYAIDRSSFFEQGTLTSYDLTDLENPSEAGTLDIPEWPTTLTLIPSYPFPDYRIGSGSLAVMGCVEEQSYLAIFSGVSNDRKKLTLVPATGEFDESRVISATISIQEAEASQIVASKWDPPLLGYLEYSDVTSIVLLNLPAFLAGAKVAREDRDVFETLPRAGAPGLDSNGDGDYCDSGEEAPLPFLDPLHPFGFSFSFAPRDPRERIQDFDFNSGILAAVSAFNDPTTKARFRVILAAADPDSLESAVVEFEQGQRPTRMVLLPGTRLETSTTPVLRDIAVVAMAPGGSSPDGELAIIDLSDPSEPALANHFRLPIAEGGPHSLIRREDGLVALATSRSILLIDPARLLIPETGVGSHPAFVTDVRLAAAGTRDFASEVSGVHAVFNGGERRVMQTAPRFQVVTFDQAPIDGEAFFLLPTSEKLARLRAAHVPPVIDLAKTDSDGEVLADLSPERHHYVLLDAPGGDPSEGKFIPVVVGALANRGNMYDRRAKNMVPSVIGDNSVQKALFVKQIIRTATVLSKLIDKGRELVLKKLDIFDLASEVVRAPELRETMPEITALGDLAKEYLKAGPFRARRLSDDPSHPLYNRYLAGPFVVLPNSPDKGLLDALISQLENRRYLQASPRLWAGFPSENVFEGGEGEAIEQFQSQFRLNPDLSFEGVIDLPLIDGLAEQLLQSIAGQSDTFVPVVLSAVTALTPVSADYHPTLMPGASIFRQVAYADRPLILIPGLGGSRLNQSDGELWPGVFVGSKSNLAVRPNGVSQFTTVPPDVTRNLVELELLGDYSGFVGMYRGLLKTLQVGLGYVEYDYFNPLVPGDDFRFFMEERRRQDGDPVLGLEPKPDLFVFPYDWRLDHKRASDLLDKYVQIIRRYHPDADGIDIIAHGTGNYVARQYALDHPELVRNHLALAAPWLGSAQPLVAMLTGDMENLALNLLVPVKELRMLAQFMPGLHEALPNKGMFDQGFRPVTELGFDLNRDGTNFQTYTYPQYTAALATNLFTKTHAEAGFTGIPSPVPGNHEAFHRPNDGLPVARGEPNLGGTLTYQFLSVQSVPRTFSGIRLLGRLHRNATNIDNTTLDLPSVTLIESEEGPGLEFNVGDADGPIGVTTNQYRFRANLEVARSLGDGMVPMASAARGFGSGLDFNADGTRVFPLVSQDPESDDEVSHYDVFSSPRLRDWVERILSARQVKGLELTLNAPGSVNEGESFTISVGHSSQDGSPGDVTKLIDFGDGGSAAQTGLTGVMPQLTHRYAQSGSYTISVGASSSEGFSGFASRRIDVANVAPQVVIEGGNLTVAPFEMRIVVACVTDPGMDDTHTFTWTLDGQTLADRHSFALPVSFAGGGPYELRVKAEDSDGAQSSEAVVMITVDPNAAPQDPLSAAPGCAMAASVPPPPVQGQAEAVVRITGLAPGPFGSKGIRVREGSDSIFDVQVLVVPGVPLPPIPVGVIKRVASAVTDVLAQRGFDETAVVYLTPRPKGSGTPPKAIVECTSRGGPLEVELLYSVGGVAQKFTAWETNVSSSLFGRDVSVELDWTSLQMTLKADGAVVPPRHEATGLRAGDRAPPSVAAIVNPASGDVIILGRDNFTPAERLEFFLVQDSTGNGELGDEVFYELGTNVIKRARLPSRLFTIVARDDLNNVSRLEPLELQSLLDFGFLNADYCQDLEAVRIAANRAIQDGLNDAAVSGMFLLSPSHLWAFEQGSGACLWKANFCDECNGNYRPGASDNDYQVFLPVHVERNYQFNATDRADFLAEGPYTEGALRGDWYFKPPVGLDAAGMATTDDGLIVAWEYLLPPGFTTPTGDRLLVLPRVAFTGDLTDGFPVPLTPAEVISLAFTEAAKAEPLLVESTFFPVRREHFMFGVLDMEPPPGFGADPIGDGGTGRQMLLLKWALEGAFVQVAGGTGINQGLPAMDDVYQNLRDAGVPVAEGFEWGVFQEFAALSAGVAEDLRATYGPAADPQPLHSPVGNDLEKIQRKKLKSMGKAAIRAALARLAGDPQVAPLLFSITRQDYLSQRIPSFEDFILAVITNNAQTAQALFAEYGQDRDPEIGPDIFDFLVAKKNLDETFFDELFRRPDGYRKFILGGVDFLRRLVQTPVQPTYDSYMDDLLASGDGEEERAARARNLYLVFSGTLARPGLDHLRQDTPNEPLKVVLGINNYMPQTASGIIVHATTGGSGPAPAPSPAPLGNGFAGEDLELLPMPPMPPPPQDIPIPDAPPLETAATEDPGEPTLVLDSQLTPGQIEETILEAPDPGNAMTEPIAEDGSATIVREELMTTTPAPVPLPPLMAVRVGRVEGPPLNDHPDIPLLQRASPGRYLRRDEPLFCVVSAPPGGAGFTVLVSTETTPNQVPFQLSEVSSQPGTYASPPIRLGPTESLHVIEEETITFELQGAAGETQRFRIDVAELAASGIDKFYANVDRAPVLTGAGVGAGFSVTGDLALPDTTGQDPTRPFAAFLRNAGDQEPDFFEADFLHFSAHGAKDGSLFDDASNLMFDPRVGGVFPGRWGEDVEWAVLAACNTLSDQPPGIGLNAWSEALMGSRRAHGILGAYNPVSRDLADHFRLFWQDVALDEPFARAYRHAMEEGRIGGTVRPQNWAFTCWRANERDRFSSLGPDQVTAFLLSDFADLAGLPDCLIDGRQQPGDAGLAVAALRARLRAEPQRPSMPPAVSLMVSEPLRNLTRGQYRRGTQGRLDRRQWGLEHDREAVTVLDRDEALRTVQAFLWTDLPELAPQLEHDYTGYRVSQDIAPDGRVTAWTNSYLVTYHVLFGGVRVWGDQLQVNLVGNDVAWVAGQFHVSDPRVEAGEPKPVLRGDQSLDRALARLPASHQKGIPREAVLAYAPEPLARGGPGDATRYVLAWRFELQPSEDHVRPGPPAVVWVDAISGAVLSVKP